LGSFWLRHAATKSHQSFSTFLPFENSFSMLPHDEALKMVRDAWGFLWI
jgi:hypothetical protein